MSAPNKAVILARGLGSRMRQQAAGVELDARQSAAADAGVKAMISAGERPFLDYVLSALADAGFTSICLVIGPEHDMIREYYDALPKERISISYAIQREPLGTANAVLAAEDFAGEDRVLVINSDNYYPPEALQLLAHADGSAMIGFDKTALIARSNIPAARIAAFAVVSMDAEGNLGEIYEKPDAETLARLGDEALVSMNCWLCGPAIFPAARSIPKSARGEYEITDAVRAAIASGDPYRVIPAASGVLDMSSRGDIASVVAALAGLKVAL